MKPNNLTLHHNNTTKTIPLPAGAPLFPALTGAGVDFGSNCGGRGACGKCRVKALSGAFGPPAGHELSALSEAALAAGVRLACHLSMPEGGCTIEAVTSGAAKVLTTGAEEAYEFDPRGKAEDEAYALAVDIGTTTLAAYLIDLRTGGQLCSLGALNPQRAVGADVVARAGYTIENPNGMGELSAMIREAIADMAKRLCDDAAKILHVTLVGNTVMMHIAAQLPVNTIAVAPYTPYYTEGFEMSAAELGWAFAPNCIVSFLPCVAGYVGADTIAAVMASGMAEREELSLLLDIGTNGEMALGSRDKLLACSTAAGPAFEGGHIRHGMGGVAGAINSVYVEDGSVRYTTINDAPPKGICGSGLIDAVALLVREGMLDETGLMEDENGRWPESIKDADEKAGGCMFTLARSGGEDIAVTQRDIREVQLAKGAIAAGIEILLREWGAKEEDVEKVYLAGGFGTYIDYDSACTVGLIPKGLRSKIVSLGNAAGTGAKQAARSKARLAFSEAVRENTRYVELAGRADFQDIFVEKMMFEE